MGFKLQEFSLWIQRLWIEGLSPMNFTLLIIATTHQMRTMQKTFDGTMNDIEGWGENGTTAELINITTNIDEPTTTKAYVHR